MRSIVDTVLARLGASDRLGLALMRVAIAVIFLWIGALKFVPYEADSITRRLSPTTPSCRCSTSIPTSIGRI